MEDAGNDLNIVILDACRDNPFARSFRSSSSGLARMDAPKGSIVAYSTSPGKLAVDGKGRNSPYTAALLEYMDDPGQTIEQVFKKCRRCIDKATGGKQIPWESTSLTGVFYFVSKGTDNSLNEEQDRLERERRELEQMKVEIERKKLEVERKRLEAEKQKLETAKLPPKQEHPPSVSTGSKGGEIARDGRFIAYDNSTVLDTKTNLMWAAKDDGKGLFKNAAKDYIAKYRGGGYTDWRMPTMDELKTIYDWDMKNQHGYHVTKLIDITDEWVWGFERRPNINAFSFFRGSPPSDFGDIAHWGRHYSSARALPVRSGN